MRSCIVILTAATLLGTAGLAGAGETTFLPSPVDLLDLPHAWCFTWGVDFELPEGEVITEVVLTLEDIYDWKVEPDHLYIHLLDNPLPGVVAIKDRKDGTDNFADQGVLIDDWSDPLGGPTGATDLVYNFSILPGSEDGTTLLDDFNAFLATSAPGMANIGFGIDPDCHYYNSGCSFTISSKAIHTPAPGALLLSGAGVVIVGWLRRTKML